MKKIFSLVLLALSLIAFTEVFGKKEAVKQTAKQVEFRIAAASNYNYNVYEESYATIQLRVYKSNKQGRELLWSKLIDPIQLNRFPDAANALSFVAEITEVNHGHDRLEASYEVVYNTRGSILNTESSLIRLDARDRDVVPVLV